MDIKIKRVKITVLKKEFYGNYAEKYLTDGKEVGPCPLLNEGEVFVYEGGAEMPNEFCPWAWIDIYRNIVSVFHPDYSTEHRLHPLKVH